MKHIFRYKTFLSQPPANGVKDLVISWCFSSHRITWVFHSQNQSSCTHIIKQWRSEAWGSKKNDITRLFCGEKGKNYCEKNFINWSFHCALVCKDSQIWVYFNNIIIFINTKQREIICLSVVCSVFCSVYQRIPGFSCRNHLHITFSASMSHC